MKVAFFIICILCLISIDSRLRQVNDNFNAIVQTVRDRP